MSCSFTRADVDGMCRVLCEESRLDWVMEADIIKKHVKPAVPVKFVTRSTFDHLAKVTGAKVERDVTKVGYDGSKMDMVNYGGVLFYAYQVNGGAR